MIRPRLLDWYLNANGIQIYADWQGEARGWLNMSCECPECHQRWEAVAAVGSLGIECPKCGHCQVDYQWEEVEE